MSDPYIPAEDRIDVIGRLTARLDDAGAETLREKAVASAKAMSIVQTRSTPIKPSRTKVRRTSEGRQRVKATKRTARRTRRNPRTRGREGNSEGRQGRRRKGKKKGRRKGSGTKEVKGRRARRREGARRTGEKDPKDHKDGDEKDLPEGRPEGHHIEGPDGAAADPRAEASAPRLGQ